MCFPETACVICDPQSRWTTDSSWANQIVSPRNSELRTLVGDVKLGHWIAPQSTKEVQEVCRKRDECVRHAEGLAGQKEAPSWLRAAFQLLDPVCPEVQLYFLTCALFYNNPPAIYFPFPIQMFQIDFSASGVRSAAEERDE